MTEMETPEAATENSESQSQPGFIRRILNVIYNRTLGRIDSKFMQFLTVGAGLLILLTLCPFLFAMFLGWNDLQRAAAFFEYVRDLVTIVLSVQMILIIVAIAILIAQIAWFVNLLSSEVSPILKDTREAAKNVRVTTEFAGEQVTEPLVKIKSFFAGLAVFLREIFKIRRIVRPKPTVDSDSQGVTDEQP